MRVERLPPYVYGNVATRCAHKGCDRTAVKGSSRCLVHIETTCSWEEEVYRSRGGRRNPLVGWIYFVKAEGIDRVKIGKAKNVERRLIGMQVGCPSPLVCLTAFKCSDYHEMERTIHGRLAAHRVTGEWFDMSDKVVELVGAVLDEGEMGARRVLGIKFMDV